MDWFKFKHYYRLSPAGYWHFPLLQVSIGGKMFMIIIIGLGFQFGKYSDGSINNKAQATAI